MKLKVLYLIAWSFYRQGEPQKAVEFLFSQPETTPILEWQKEFLWIMADEAWMRSDYPESVTYLLKIIDQTEKDSYKRHFWFAHLKLAHALSKTWHFREASKIYEEIWQGNVPEDIKILAKMEEGGKKFSLTEISRSTENHHGKRFNVESFRNYFTIRGGLKVAIRVRVLICHDNKYYRS